MKKLPIGIQDFEQLITGGYVYVDKTQLIHDLINSGVFLFYARPRRFGKSLLLSTLAALFSGKKELFKGLWVEENWNWKPRPVLTINFNDVNYHNLTIEKGLSIYLDELARENDIQLKHQDYKNKFLELIKGLSKKSADGRIVLLIDEYDKPITDVLEDTEKLKKHLAALKHFFAVLKSSVASKFHFAFLTGVSKYGKVSVFSDLNNLFDISLNPTFHNLTGYTQIELEYNFEEYLAKAEAHFSLSKTIILDKLRIWYNGYSWDGTQRLYNPFSILNFFANQRFDNYWFSSATPSFLLKTLHNQGITSNELEAIYSSESIMNVADVEHIDIFALLLQSGYLTIKSIKTTGIQNQLLLSYPNLEVKHSFLKHLLSFYTKKSVSRLDISVIQKIQTALLQHNFKDLFNIINSLLASIPFQIFQNSEAGFHSILHIIFELTGFQIQSEKSGNLGSADTILESPTTIYIFEFKKNKTAKIALKQIEEKGYAKPFLHSEKSIFIIGVNFNAEKREIDDWGIKEIK